MNTVGETQLPAPHDPNPYAAPSHSVAPSGAVAPELVENSPQLSADSASQQVVPAGLAGAGPILVSSGLFAALHYGHGIDPFPLFVLALVLGWLYQRTHRLWPCVVLHMALNSITVAILFLAR